MNAWLSRKFHWMSFIATWAVVCIHSHTMRWNDAASDWANRFQMIMLNAFHFAVPLFFVISGYVFVLSWRKYRYGEFLCKKFTGLYIPAVLGSWLIMLLVMPIRIYSGNFVPSFGDFVKVLWLDFSSGCVHLWYVRALIVAFLLAPVLYFSIRKWWLGVVLMAVAVTVHYDVHWFALNIPRTVFYMIGGGLLAYNVGAERLYRMRGDGWASMALGVAIMLSAIVARRWNILFFESFSFPVGQILFLSGLYDLIDSKLDGGVPAFPGRFAVMFFIYCFHLVTISWIGGCLRLVLGTGGAARITAYFILWSTFFIDILLANAVRKLFPKIYQILAGGR